MTSAPVVPILFGGLIVWSIYRRVRRNIGRQKLNPRRALTSLIILSIFSVVIVGISLLLRNMNLLLGSGSGLLLGALLGFIGLRLTRFETNDEGHFYIPNARIGVALSILLIARMAYRLWLHPEHHAKFRSSAIDAKSADFFHHRPDVRLLHRLSNGFVHPSPRPKIISAKKGLCIRQFKFRFFA